MTICGEGKEINGFRGCGRELYALARVAEFRVSPRKVEKMLLCFKCYDIKTGRRDENGKLRG